MGVSLQNSRLCPRPEDYLPDLIGFLENSAGTIDRGETDWKKLSENVQQFFTSLMLDRIDAVLPGWREMASYAGGLTLIHVCAVYIHLLLAPEYQQLNADQQLILQWTVLFHDLTKVVRDLKGDPTHAFRSAALACRQLPALGIAVNSDRGSALAERIETAVVMVPDRDTPVQDNRRLPEILEGIQRLYGKDTPAALIIKVVLFHMSITIHEMWRQAAPLTDAEIQAYIDDSLFPVLRVMMIVDGVAWDFYNGDPKVPGRVEGVAAFDRIAGIMRTELHNANSG